MPKSKRIEFIKKIQEERGTHVITYLTSARPNLDVPMAMDSVRIVYDHLCRLNASDWGKVDLFLFSNGGDGTVPWRLVTLIREKAQRFSVLIPFKAFSAATLTALGADSVVMHPMGTLGPTDPMVTNPFNPTDGANKRVPISVEDVTAYLALIREDAGIRHDDEVVIAFNQLASQVHPLALGNVKRFMSQSRMMAKKLLSLHMDPRKDEHRIKEIVDNLTSKLFYHGHPIYRDEARDQVGLQTVENCTGTIETLMWDLYLDYEAEMEMRTQFHPVEEFMAAFPVSTGKGTYVTQQKTAKVAFIESEHDSDVSCLDYRICGSIDENGMYAVQNVQMSQEWRKD